MKIALIGHPGSGKAYSARRLSEKINAERIDIDALFDNHPIYFISTNLYRRKLTNYYLENAVGLLMVTTARECLTGYGNQQI